MPRRAKKPKRRRRIRFNWKAALLLVFLVSFLAALVIGQPSVWHWIIALVITGLGIELARVSLRAK